MAPNHDGDPLGAILGPMGSHWVQKMGQNVENYLAKIRIFDDPAVIDFSQKDGSYGYGVKSWWGPPRVHLGANGVQLGKKMGQNRKKITMLQNFQLPRGHRFFPKNGSYGYGAKSRWGPLGAILGPMGSHWVKKMGQNRKKLPCPKIRIFDYPAVIDFSQKMEVTFIAPNQGRDSLGSILRPMGSHWVQIMGQYGKIAMPQNSNFRRPLGHRFFPKNGSYGYGAKLRWGPPRGHLGANGSQWVQKMGQNR